ncbi:stage II sporulation protein M [Candidatus Woesearchaeota archaeon]|nr:stage II sporulation protein M [Candidatus Woesearchaeota archaeon]
MVLESLFNPFIVKKKPYEMFLAGFLYSIVGVFLGYAVFREIAGILAVFLIVMATVPLLYTTIKEEEELDLKYDKEIILLKEHTKVLLFLMFLFLGITSALVLLYVFLPHSMTSEIFVMQEQAILNVNSNLQGNVTGFAIKLDILSKIFMNNLKVLFFCLIFAVLYGTGAIFILTWNASVIAVAMGNFIKLEIGKVVGLVGFSSASSYFWAATFSLIRSLTHGIFEIAAYFIAGLGGGIISVALVKHNFGNEKVLIDAMDLILISLGVLFMAALVEVFITPALFA